MSLICIGVALLQSPNIAIIKQKLSEVAVRHKRGITFGIDWYEPITDFINEDSFLFSLTDSPENDNCEMLLLPDNNFLNDKTNELPLGMRLQLLQDLSKVIIATGHYVEYYIGLSGTLTAEYDTFMVRNHDLPIFLEKVISSSAPSYAIHLIVC